VDKIYIIDAVNYLFRSYYAIGPMLNDKGQSTSALFGFIRSIQKLIKDFSPTHLVAVFDGPDNKKSRQSMYAEYKMHRKGAPEDLFPQFELAYKYCKLAGISTLCIDGVEADDTMATVALWAEKQGATAYICSSDKDLMQLVNDRIFLLQQHKNNLIIDAAGVKAAFGVPPAQMLDLLAIMGDTSDNIPGLEGFGPKTAASLLNEFGSLDYILEHPEKVKGEKKQQTLREQKERALMSRQLATLHTDIEIPRDVEFYKIKPIDKENLISFFHEMKFHSLLKELDAPTPSKQTTHSSPFQIEKKYQLIDSEIGLNELLQTLNEKSHICIDTETTDINPFFANLVGIGFSYGPGIGFYVPLNGSLGKKAVIIALKTFFARTKTAFYGHNLKYDYHILKGLGIQIPSICFDTMLASYVLDPQERRHNLDSLVLEKYRHVKTPIEQLIGKGKNTISMREVPIEKVAQYCCEDVDYTARLKELFEPALAEKGLAAILYDIELPLLPILAEMERTGITLNIDKLRKIREEVLKELDQIKAAIFSLSQEEFNLNSPKQLSTVLYEKLAIKSTSASTGADVLEELETEHPIISKILSYRTLEKLRSTYIEALPHAVNPITGKIHCTFSQSTAATGRLACQNPNLQNIPLHSAIRSCFEASNGHSFIGADYSQIELRLLAHFCQDPELIKAFNTGVDIHMATASKVFAVSYEQVTPSMRAQAKTVNFGVLYGQSAFGLSKQLKIPIKEASDFIKTYFENYPKVSSYLEECKSLARKTGVARTLTGRKRPIPELHNKNPSIRAAAERLAINTPLQGTAADLIKLAMIAIDREIRQQGLKGKMILQIHDELIFEVPDEELVVFQTLITDKMENVFKLSVPLEVHIAVGKNWSEC
jgi:DNA polymerase-1